MIEELDWPPDEPCEHERNVGHQDQPLVRGRSVSHSVGKRDEHRGNEHNVGVDEKEQVFEASRNASPQNIHTN